MQNTSHPLASWVGTGVSWVFTYFGGLDSVATLFAILSSAATVAFTVVNYIENKKRSRKK